VRAVIPRLLAAIPARWAVIAALAARLGGHPAVMFFGADETVLP